MKKNGFGFKIKYPWQIWLVIFLLITTISQARLTNPYPVALLRQGDIYLLRGKGDGDRLTQSGDVTGLCWLDRETLCFARELKSGLADRQDWRGFEAIRDLFTIKIGGGAAEQFTIDHFTSEPAPSAMPQRALFTRRVQGDSLETEIWETLRPLIRDRSLGIRGHQPDSSPDQKWLAAALGKDKEGIGIYRYPTHESYRKIDGPYDRPRFSPDSRELAFLNWKPGNQGVWSFLIPDGIPSLIVKTPPDFETLLDFGWAEDGSGLILLLAAGEKREVFFWDRERQTLTQITNFGDIDQATAWH